VFPVRYELSLYILIRRNSLFKVLTKRSVARLFGVECVDDTRMIWKEVVVAYSTYYPRIYLDGLRTTTKTPQSGWPVSHTRLETRTSRIQVKRFTAMLTRSIPTD
jgi:hypothetical protein